MSENNQSFLKRPIKDFSSSELQKTIASALSKLIGEKYEAEIKNINYNHSKTSLLDDSTEFTIVVRKESKWEK